MGVQFSPPRSKKKERLSMARPEKINQSIIDKIVSAIRQGAYVETAAAYAGINKDTFYDWLKKGANEKLERQKAIEKNIKRSKKYQLQVLFSDAIEKAMAESELFDLSVITQAAKNGTWQAAAWRLERKFPKRYGPAIFRVNEETNKQPNSVDALIEKLKAGNNNE